MFLFCYVCCSRRCLIPCRLQVAANEVLYPFLHQLDGLKVTILLLRSQLQNVWLKQKPCELATLHVY